MSLLESYEREFASLQKDIAHKTSLVPDLTGDEKTKEIRGAERDIDESHDLIEQMELEVMDLPAASRAKAKKKIAAYKKDIEIAERELRRAAVALSGSQSARDELFGYDGSSEDAKQALLTNTDRLDRTTRRLEDGHRLALETEEIAVGIMGDLHSQRETIERSRGRLRHTDAELGTSSNILNRMIYRAKQNKVVTFLVIFFTTAVIGVLIYLIATK
eukprot:m.482037 g.482037  ORF g.482037 m.482037 type:complete len:217 (-) comp22413_c0_seq1:28-678(-)